MTSEKMDLRVMKIDICFGGNIFFEDGVNLSPRQSFAQTKMNHPKHI